MRAQADIGPVSKHVETGNTQRPALQAATPVDVQPPFAVGTEPARTSALLPEPLQQRSKPAIDIDSAKLVKISGGSGTQQGQQVVTEDLRMNPSKPIARYELLLGSG